MPNEEFQKGLTIIACVEPLVFDAQLCLMVGSAYENEGLFEEALHHYDKAEKGFIRAEQRWNEILDNWKWPPEFPGLKKLVTTGYMEGEVTDG